MILFGSVLGVLTSTTGAAVMLGIIAYFVGQKLYQRDESKEDRRRHAIEIATELRAEGLEHIPGVLVDYAVGDYSGMTARVKGWYDQLRNDENRRAFFANFRRRQLEVAMKNDSLRGEVLKAVDEWQAVEEVKRQKSEAEIRAKIAAETTEKQDVKATAS